MTRGKARNSSARAAKSILQALHGANRKMAAATHVQQQLQNPPISPLNLPGTCTSGTPELLSTPPDPTVAAMETLTARFEAMLTGALNSLAAKLTSEISELGVRTVEIETRVDTLDATVATYERKLASLQDDHLQLTLKMEDLENRSRRSNLRIRGLPEHITDVPATVTSLFQELSPSLPIDRLEADRAHRALTRRKPEGPPRDIIVKLHYYKTKDTLLHAARELSKAGPLMFQGHQYQLFADIAPSTITRRRELKPFLEVLVARQIPYRWGFPFRLIFTYNGKHISGSSFAELSSAFRQLNLPLTTPSKNSARNGTLVSPEKKKARMTPSPSLRNRLRHTDDDEMG